MSLQSAKGWVASKMTTADEPWPALDWQEWRDTALTLQLWMQIVGKVRLALTPWLNHSWHVTLYVSARGLTTSPIVHGDQLFELEFDFLRHRLQFRDSLGREDFLSLQSQSVADFDAALLGLLTRHGIDVTIYDVPNEIEAPVPFSQDRIHSSYDPDAAERFWRILMSADQVFKRFRTGFIGKTSPVHFFWGSFDLAVTRFSGRTAPLHPGGVPHLPDAVTREAYSHEVSSAGFWPGSDAYPHAAFYSYAYPIPPGFTEMRVMPDEAYYDTGLGEFILRYDDLRRTPNPSAVLMTFLSSTYEAAARSGGWDRSSLECEIGIPGVPRPV
jgi:hypothetical protein